MLIYYLLVWPYRRMLNLHYRRRPLASEIVKAYLRQRNYPEWTSFFLAYRHVQDDLFGEKHINFPADNCNYHMLRVGCFPYVKYHLTKRPWSNLDVENRLFKLITVANLGVPALLYGLAAIALIRHTEYVTVDMRKRTISIPIHFLIEEQH